MTTKQENQIHLLRSEGKGYTAIANLLGLSVNTVKSYCRRNNLQGVRSGGNSNEVHAFCKQCGAELPQASGQKERKFCSDVCRMKWWNSHQEQVERKAIYNFTCANCGKPFALTMQSQGIITDREFAIISTKLREKYQPVFGTLFSESA